jgi:hypothetical protein
MILFVDDASGLSVCILLGLSDGIIEVEAFLMFALDVQRQG